MRLLIDTDPGIDDALALLLALASPDASIEAITTVAGNVSVEQATTNLVRVLSVACPGPFPPIGRGAAAPLARPLITAGDIHGDDGLGNLDRFLGHAGQPRYPRPSAPLEMRDATELILETSRRFGQELIVVALGPLTNLALALGRDRQALSQVGRVVVMGGAVAVPGNTTAAAEFNFYVDPEAAAAVVDSGLPIELIPLDVTHQTVVKQTVLADRLARSPSPVAQFVADFTVHGFASESGGLGGLVMHDPLAMGVALDPSLVGFEPHHVVVECQGQTTRGMSVADRRPASGRRPLRPNCRVAMSVDAARFIDTFLDRVCPASR